MGVFADYREMPAMDVPRHYLVSHVNHSEQKFLAGCNMDIGFIVDLSKMYAFIFSGGLRMRKQRIWKSASARALIDARPNQYQKAAVDTPCQNMC